MTTTLKAKGPYDLRTVVFSHGWSDLPPFRVRGDSGEISLAIRANGKGMVVRLLPAKNSLRVETREEQLPKEGVADIRQMFRLDDDLTSFYSHAEQEEREWISERKMGRLLRSQTVFEDLIKLILTTNCSWSLTKSMTNALVKLLGEKVEEDFYLFPDAETLASKTEQFYRDKVRAGYRSAHLPVIAKRVASNDLQPETWRDLDRPTEDVRKEILSVPGAGPYVADNLLRFLGRYDALGLDSWARAKLKKMWGMKKIPTDKTIHRRYSRHGSFRGLVLWCDLTEDWLSG